MRRYSVAETKYRRAMVVVQSQVASRALDPAMIERLFVINMSGSLVLRKLRVNLDTPRSQPTNEIHDTVSPWVAAYRFPRFLDVCLYPTLLRQVLNLLSPLSCQRCPESLSPDLGIISQPAGHHRRLVGREVRRWGGEENPERHVPRAWEMHN